jgi:hypothetical protein
MFGTDEVRGLFEQMRNTDIATASNYVTMKKITKALGRHGLDFRMAGLVASRMKINVSQDIVDNDAELIDDCTDAFGEFLVKMHKQMVEDFGLVLGEEMILNMASDFNFELNF